MLAGAGLARYLIAMTRRFEMADRARLPWRFFGAMLARP